MVRELSTEKREQFLKSALKLFVSGGVQHTSTAEIARDAGTAAGTLFLYFPTKQDLLNELVMKIAREQSESVKARLSPALSVRETFFTIWNGSIQWFLENMEAYLYVQQVRDTGMIAEATVQASSQYLDYYFIAIQKGLQAGAIKPYALDLIGGILYQDIVAMMNIIRAQSDPAQQAETIQQGFDIFWDGIRNQGS